MLIEAIAGASIFAAALLFYLLHYLSLIRRPRKEKKKIRHTKIESLYINRGRK